MAEKQFKPDFLPEEKFGSDIPGQGPEMLDANVSVRGGSGGTPVMKTFVVTASTTGVQNYTGFGFTPSYVNIIATGTAVIGPETYSNMTANDGILAGVTIKNDTSNDLTTRAYSLADAANLARGDAPVFIADGISIDILNSDFECRLMITCFK